MPNKVTLLFDEAAANRRAAAIDQLADAPLAPLHPATDAARRAFAKRIQDLVIGVAALVLAAPVLALIALAIRIDSPGPILFRQRRHGFNNEEIVVLEVPHDAARMPPTPGRAAGDRRRRPGHAGRPRPARDEPRRGAPAAQRAAPARCRWSARARTRSG